MAELVRLFDDRAGAPPPPCPDGTDVPAMVPAIVGQDKYFNISLPELLTLISGKGGKVDVLDEVWLEVSGEAVPYGLRLNFAGFQSARSQDWMASVKLGTTRIDGIDYEDYFDDPQGAEQQGWHRHVWSVARMDADRQKKPISIVSTTREQFIAEVLQVMRVTLSGKEVGHEFL